MASLAEIRQQYPQYDDMSDGALADAFYNKFYSDMPREQFDTKLGIAKAQPATDSVGGIGSEIGRAFGENLDAVKRVVTDYKPGDQFGHLSRVGSALAAVPGMMASPITGTARSILGGAFEAIDPLTEQERVKFGLPDAREVADKAMMGVAPRGYSPIGPRMAPATPPPAADLKKAATDVYNSPAIKAIEVAPSDVARLAEKTETQLAQQGFRPTPGSAPGTLSEVERMFPGNVQSVSIDDLRAARRSLQMTAKQVGPDFKATPDAAAAKQAMKELDDFLDNLSPDLKTANANYRAGKSAELLDYRSMQADRRAAKSGSGMNIENTMRQEVDKIPDRGMSPEQKALKEKIVLGDVPRNALRTAGKLGVEGGLSLMLHGGAALGSGGSTLPITVSGTLARKLGEILTRQQISKLNSMIRSSSPLGQSLAPTTLPAPSPLLSGPLSNASLAELLSRLRPFPPAVPSYAEGERQ